MVMHGIGHGALIRASVKLNGPMPACGDIPHCDESMAALSADFCMLAPRDDYKVQCGDGMYHGVFHHPSVKTLQRTSWAYFCETSPLAIPCFHFGLFFVGVFFNEVHDAVSAYPTVADSCKSFTDARIERACVFGLSATMIPLFREMLLSERLTAPVGGGEGAWLIDDLPATREALEALCKDGLHRAHAMKVKLHGSARYCSMLIGRGPNPYVGNIAASKTAFAKLLDPAKGWQAATPFSDPIIRWCANFVDIDAEALTEQSARLLSACVRGSVQFTTDTRVYEYYAERAYTAEGSVPPDYCRELANAPAAWKPLESLELCYRVISWDYQNYTSTWSSLVDL